MNASKLRLNQYGYLERKTVRNRGNQGDNSCFRNWWLVKNITSGKDFVRSGIRLGNLTITLPKEYLGKRVRIKVEVVGDATDKS